MELAQLSLVYIASIGRPAYLWAWPMINIHNRLVAFGQLPEPGLIGGIIPAGPPNTIGMPHDYVDPGERIIAARIRTSSTE